MKVLILFSLFLFQSNLMAKDAPLSEYAKCAKSINKITLSGPWFFFENGSYEYMVLERDDSAILYNLTTNRATDVMKPGSNHRSNENYDTVFVPFQFPRGWTAKWTRDQSQNFHLVDVQGKPKKSDLQEKERIYGNAAVANRTIPLDFQDITDVIGNTLETEKHRVIDYGKYRRPGKPHKSLDKVVESCPAQIKTQVASIRKNPQSLGEETRLATSSEGLE